MTLRVSIISEKEEFMIEKYLFMIHLLFLIEKYDSARQRVVKMLYELLTRLAY